MRALLPMTSQLFSFVYYRLNDSGTAFPVVIELGVVATKDRVLFSTYLSLADRYHLPKKLHPNLRLEYYKEVCRIVVVEHLAVRAQVPAAVDAAEPFANNTGHALITNCCTMLQSLEVI